MKRIVLCLVTLLMLTGAAEASTATLNPDLINGVWVKISINFHRPKNACKTGFGLCVDLSAGIEKPVTATGTDLCPVRVRLTDKNEFVLEVTDDALSKYEMGSTKPYFSGKTSITLQEPYTLSPGTCRALGANGALTVKAGTYPVTYANGTYTVVFQL